MFKKLKLTYYDKRVNASENLEFLKRLLNSSKQGLLISFCFIGVLIGLDFGIRQIAKFLCNSTINFLNSFADILYKINDVIGIKFLDYFKDVIVIVAGILGVILGLFFTTFLNIVTSKYANINSVITYQLLEQKVINRYFKLLAILVSSAIIFQFLLVIGYKPTFISSSLFTIAIIISLLAFIFFGKYSLRYFNAGHLVSDLINSCYQTLNRAHKNKKYFNANQNGKQTLKKIISDIKKVKLIIEESTKPQLINTALDSISEELLSFAILYNSCKHTFPSDKNWHPTTQKYKSWDEASSSDYEMFNNVGATPSYKTVSDYLYIEKQLINIQFHIFKNLADSNTKAQLVYKQYKYLHIISFQCEVELFDIFFNHLEEYIKENLQKADANMIENNLQFISLYAYLLIQYLVGFNYNFERLITEQRLRKLAQAIHNLSDTDSIMQFPYTIRVWADQYQQKLLNENFFERKIQTPLFYTEFELAYQFQLLFKSSFEQISTNLHKRIITFLKYLKTSKLELELLEFLSATLDVYNKIEFFSGIIENKIIKEIDTLNLEKEEKFAFPEREGLLEKNQKTRKIAIDEIWQAGKSGYAITSKNLPDIYGNFYQLICNDIMDKAFENNAIELEKYLSQFYKYNLLYIGNLREKIDRKRIIPTTAKLFPVIVDLFEISSIAIIMFKAYNNKKLENAFNKFWDNVFDGDVQREKEFWSNVLPIYEYFKQPLVSLSTPSYVKEYKREERLVKFLQESNLVRLEDIKENFLPFMQHYVTDIEDIYFKVVVDNLSPHQYRDLNIDLPEIFFEYFLRNRTTLQDLNIKETEYGKKLRRYLDEDSE
jgi:hypothetical protein